MLLSPTKKWYIVLIFWALVISIFVYWLGFGRNGEGAGGWLFAGFLSLSVPLTLLILMASLLKYAGGKLLAWDKKHYSIASISIIIVLIAFRILSIWDILSFIGSAFDDFGIFVITYPWLFLPAVFAGIMSLSARILNISQPIFWRLSLAPTAIITSILLALLPFGVLGGNFIMDRFAACRFIYGYNHQSNCSLRVALRTGNPYICDNFRDQLLKSNCFENIAVARKDIKFCKETIPFQTEAGELTNDDCILNVALYNRDQTLCPNIKDKRLQKKCLHAGKNDGDRQSQEKKSLIEKLQDLMKGYY